MKKPPTFTGRLVTNMKEEYNIYMCIRGRVNVSIYRIINKYTCLLIYLGTGLQNVIDILSLAVLDFNGAMLALIAANAVLE